MPVGHRSGGEAPVRTYDWTLLIAWGSLATMWWCAAKKKYALAWVLLVFVTLMITVTMIELIGSY
jgi:hypothetical protein